jgi:hypothetical protein
MSAELAAAPQPSAAPSTVIGALPGFDDRWAAWLAKGVAQDRAFRRRMAVVAPILIAAAAVVLYAFVGR